MQIVVKVDVDMEMIMTHIKRQIQCGRMLISKTDQGPVLFFSSGGYIPPNSLTNFRFEVVDNGCAIQKGSQKVSPVPGPGEEPLSE